MTHPWYTLLREAEHFELWGQPCCRKCAGEELRSSLARLAQAFGGDRTPQGLAMTRYLTALPLVIDHLMRDCKREEVKP